MTHDVPYRSLALRRTYQTHGALWHEHVSRDVSSVQYGVLYFLCEHGELGQRELMDLAELDKSTLAELLRRMETQGTVTTRRDTTDKRRKTVTVTAQGRATFEELRPDALLVNNLLTDALTEQEERMLDTLLRKINSTERNADDAEERVAG